MQLTNTQSAAINATAAVIVHLTEQEFEAAHCANLTAEDIGGMTVYYNTQRKLKAFYDYEFAHGFVFAQAVA
jgi:hypothetical protein